MLPLAKDNSENCILIMAEGINMGRKSPWNKDEYLWVYNKVSNYANILSVQLLQLEGAESASEAIAAYNIYKCPAIYLFIHYHYGKFEDLGMTDDERATYLMLFLPHVKALAKELKKAYLTWQIFKNDDSNKELSSKLIDIGSFRSFLQ